MRPRNLSAASLRSSRDANRRPGVSIVELCSPKVCSIVSVHCSWNYMFHCLTGTRLLIHLLSTFNATHTDVRHSSSTSNPHVICYVREHLSHTRDEALQRSAKVPLRFRLRQRYPAPRRDVSILSFIPSFIFSFILSYLSRYLLTHDWQTSYCSITGSSYT
jgi:hypothetical protein